MQSLMLIIAGFAGLLVNTVVLRWLLRVAGERRVLCIGALPSPPICSQEKCLYGQDGPVCPGVLKMSSPAEDFDVRHSITLGVHRVVAGYL